MVCNARKYGHLPVSHYEGLLFDNLYKKFLTYEKAPGKLYTLTRNALLYYVHYVSQSFFNVIPNFVKDVPITFNFVFKTFIYP